MDALKNPNAKWNCVKINFACLGNEVVYSTQESYRKLSAKETAAILNRLVTECKKHLSPAELNNIIVKE